MNILKGRKKIKKSENEFQSVAADCIGFGFRNADIVMFGWQKHDDIFVEMSNAVNAMIANLKDERAYIISEDRIPVLVSYEQAVSWYLACVTTERNKMNLNEALKK